MTKTIYTERDIEDLARRGVKEIIMTDQVYVTDIARERAEKLSIALRTTATPVVPSSPLPTVSRENAEQLISQVKADVIAKLGSGVDVAVIERIVRRVVGQME
jgi:hypothetical protein